MTQSIDNSNLIIDWKGLITKEIGLPFPIVHYPEFFGSFIGFSETEDSDIYFCSCFKNAIKNFIEFRILFDERKAIDPERRFILPKNHFPKRLVKKLLQSYENEEKEIITKLNFKDKICHECNIQIPSVKFCKKEHGGGFEQNYGWYIHKQFYDFGVKPTDFKILENACPDDVFSLLEMGKNEFINKYNHLNAINMLKILSDNNHIFHIETRKIRNFIENNVRDKFDAKKIGDAWVNETLLYQYVLEIFPNIKIYRHYRPEFLDFLELDIYIPDLQIGIEYQGKQHFEPIEHFGGNVSFEKLIERDEKKKLLCRKNSIELIYFRYNENITLENVKEKLIKHV